MKNNIISILIFFVLCLIGLSSCFLFEEGEFEGMKIDESVYKQVFYDDFSGNDLDGSKWERCPEWERQTHMEKHGWWKDECAYVENGNLVLECKKASDGKLISGAVRSISKDYKKTMFKNAQGIYEIKFKAEKGSGFWYAFWIFAENNPENISGSAENGAELDCFELLPGLSEWNYKGTYGNHTDRLMTTIHWDAYGDKHKMEGTKGIKVTDFDADFYDNWHVFDFVWEDEYYQCYLDGELLWKMEGSKYGNGICKVPGYMKISAEFGDWGGEIDSVINGGGTRKMLVDYVKVFVKK